MICMHRLNHSLKVRPAKNKDSDTYTAVQEYLLENCKVDIPEDYLTARVNDYEKQYVQNYCDGDASNLRITSATSTT